MTVSRRHANVRTRIGAVPYLNAIPLLYGVEDRVEFFQPSDLADAFDNCRVDLAMLPVVEYFKRAGRLLLPGIAIGSRGPVHSVKLFLNKPLKEIHRVGIDQRSRTSIVLLRVLLEQRYSLRPEYVPVDPRKGVNEDRLDALLLIGDEALRYEQEQDCLDLGAEWDAWTGLPFVFACWQVHRGFTDIASVEMVEEAAAAGRDKIDHLASLVPNIPASFVKKYLRENLCYDFGEEQEQGIQLFIRFAGRLNLPLRERRLEYFDKRNIGKGLIRISS